MTALDAHIRETGPVYQQLWVAHMIDNGLNSPHMMLLDDDRLRLSLHDEDAPRWVASVEAISETVTPHGKGHERVALDAYLPMLRVRVQLSYTRPVAVPAVARLTAVTS